MKEIINCICFVLFFFGVIGATAFIKPLNETIIEMRGE